jgi:hypothetical protein
MDLKREQLGVVSSVWQHWYNSTGTTALVQQHWYNSTGTTAPTPDAMLQVKSVGIN